MAEEKLTPWMKQYYDLKKEAGEAILFFRLWDFYEMFDDDAHIAHKVLWINITSRNKNAEKPQPMAGIPYHAMEKYLPTLVNAWYKVAIAEQVSDPNLKWIVQRKIVRIVTPATLSLEWDSYSRAESNMIASIVHTKIGYWVSFVDMSSNEWKTWEFTDFNNLATELYKISPKEVVLDKSLFSNSEIKDILWKKFSLNIYYYEFSWNARDKLINHFKTSNLEGFYLEKKPSAQKASALLLDYIEWNQKTELSFLKSISYETFSDFMWVDENTIRNLDLIYNFSTKSSNTWTLFGVLNNTKTSMWGRRLRESVVRPLQDIKEIERRLNIIDELIQDKILLSKIQDRLKLISDIDLIMNRLALGRAMPRDLLNLKKSLSMMKECINLIKDSGNEKLITLLKIK